MKIVYNGEKDTRLFKDVIGQTLQHMAEADENFIYLDADLMSCIGMNSWASEHREKAFNCGIAEANMIGIACGLAASGFHPVVHTFGPFASRRCYDQVFLSAGYAGNDITIIGTDPGVCAAFNGGTHMPFEDMALYRAIPSATIFDIADANQLISVLNQTSEIPGVKYIRVGRKQAAKIYEDGERMPVGKGIVLRTGDDCTLVASGIMVHEAMKAAAILEKENIQVIVVDMFTIKPLDRECILSCAARTGALVTAENHNKIGGLYSAVCEVVSGQCPVPVGYVAVEDEYGEVGPQDYLQKRFGLTADHIVQEVKATIARKK